MVDGIYRLMQSDLGAGQHRLSRIRDGRRARERVAEVPVSSPIQHVDGPVGFIPGTSAMRGSNRLAGAPRIPW